MYNFAMTRPTVGVLRGGTSSEYPLSLKSGAALLAALPEDRYDVRDIFIDRRGVWHSRGVPSDAVRALSQVDVALNALHGGVGEDGTVQRILESGGVAYAGARPGAAALALNKVRAREVMQAAGLKIPRGAAFSLRGDQTTADMARAVFSEFGPPYIVKPASDGASNGILIVQTLIELPDAIGDMLDAYGAALVEEYIRGEEASVGVMEHYRDQELYAFPPVHVVLPEGSTHFAFHHHDQALARHIVPSNFSHAQKGMLIEAARLAHQALGLRHFSRADIILTPRGPYVLEVNANPGLYKGASFPAMLESVGSSIREFAEHALHLAVRK